MRRRLQRPTLNATPATMVAAWVASPSHYANMIDPGFAEIGVAIDVATDGTVYLTQEFGAPLP